MITDMEKIIRMIKSKHGEKKSCFDRVVREGFSEEVAFELIPEI